MELENATKDVHFDVLKTNKLGGVDALQTHGSWATVPHHWNLSYVPKNSCKSTTANDSHHSFTDKQSALEPNRWSSDAQGTLLIPHVTTLISSDPMVELHPLGALDVVGCTFGFPCNWIFQFVPNDINNIITIIINTSSISMMMSVPPNGKRRSSRGTHITTPIRHGRVCWRTTADHIEPSGWAEGWNLCSQIHGKGLAICQRSPRELERQAS